MQLYSLPNAIKKKKTNIREEGLFIHLYVYTLQVVMQEWNSLAFRIQFLRLVYEREIYLFIDLFILYTMCYVVNGSVSTQFFNFPNTLYKTNTREEGLSIIYMLFVYTLQIVMQKGNLTVCIFFHL